MKANKRKRYSRREAALMAFAVRKFKAETRIRILFGKAPVIDTSIQEAFWLDQMTGEKPITFQLDVHR